MLKRSLFFYIPTNEAMVGNGETRLYFKNYQRDNGWKVLKLILSFQKKYNSRHIVNRTPWNIIFGLLENGMFPHERKGKEGKLTRHDYFSPTHQLSN